MIQYERHKKILDYLEVHHSATVKELAALLYSSEASIRRDIAKLEAAQRVERIYGSVLLAGHENSVVPVGVRDVSNSERKETVAKLAAQLIHDGDTIIMDASTTVFRICRHILERKHLNVITNNLRICEALAEAEGIRVYCTGGAFVGSSRCFLGASAESFIENINADKLFFSSQGISAQGLITDVSETEISMRRTMMTHARERIFLCDSTKFDIQKPFTLCHKDMVSRIICDQELVFE